MITEGCVTHGLGLPERFKGAVGELKTGVSFLFLLSWACGRHRFERSVEMTGNVHDGEKK